ncbi:MAG: sodium:solute symporter family protein, partial [Bdellovibrionales bacterium]|nr:sodium:solute symporter family protein [Bdellovibrionales bacterium]
MLLTIVAVVVGHQLRPVASKLENEQELSILDHLIMGRQLTLPLFVATLVATWYGGIFGVTRIAFEKGIFNFITQGVFWYVAYIIFALFLVNRITPYQAVTLPDLINKMFGPKSAKLSALFNFFNVLPIVYTISIGLLLQMLFHGPLWLMMAIGVGIVIIYSLFGGFRAVVFSDLVQFFVMCSGVLLVALLSYLRWGGEDFLVANLPASHFTLTGGEGIAT